MSDQAHLTTDDIQAFLPDFFSADVITAAAQGPLGIVALAILAITLVAIVMFKNAKPKVQVPMFLVLTGTFVGLSLAAMNTAQQELAVAGQIRGQIAALEGVLSEQERALAGTPWELDGTLRNVPALTGLGQWIDTREATGLNQQQIEALASLETNLSGFRKTSEDLLSTAKSFKSKYDEGEFDGKIGAQNIPGLLPRGANGTADAIVKMVCNKDGSLTEAQPFCSLFSLFVEQLSGLNSETQETLALFDRTAE